MLHWFMAMDSNDPKFRKAFYTPRVENLPGDVVDQEERMADLALFEQFREEVAPAMRAMVMEKRPPKEIFKAFQSLIAARQVTIALTARDPGKAHAAIMDIQNRVEGKPTERKEISHKLAELRDEELDALLISKMNAAKQVTEASDEDDSDGTDDT